MPTRTESDALSAVSEPLLPDVKMHLASPKEPVVGRVVESAPCTRGPKPSSFVRHITIDVSGTCLAGAFRSGQSFGVIPPGQDDKGRPHQVRLYSLACPSRGEDGSGNMISTTVKRTIEELGDEHRLYLGVASNYLCDLQPDDEVRLSGPSGKRFLLPKNPAEYDYVFFSTGTGIAPFRGMVRDLAALGMPSRAVLVSGVPYRTDLLYDDEFRAEAGRSGNFAYLTAVSREPDGEGGRGSYIQDRIKTHADVLLPLLNSPRTLIYMCGLLGMEMGVIRALQSSLAREALSGFVTIDAAAAASPSEWDRKMLGRSIKTTRRVFVETY